MKKTVYLVAVDGSEWAGRAAQRAVRLAKLTGASIHLVSVVSWSAYAPLSIENMATRPLDKKHEEAEAMESCIEPILEMLGNEGVDIDYTITWGAPAEVIHKLAKSEKVDMIFAGRRGRSNLFDMLLGSVSNKLAHHAGVPIVLVP